MSISAERFFISKDKVELYIPLILKFLSTNKTCSVWRKSVLSLVKPRISSAKYDFQQAYKFLTFHLLEKTSFSF